MKRLAMLALVLAFGISCDDSPTSPSDPNVARFTAILLPSNEVPAITNADAAASGTMQLTMTVTRDAANNITGATYDFVVNFTGFPGEHDAHRRAHPQRACRDNAGVVVGLPLTAVGHGGARPAREASRRPVCSSTSATVRLRPSPRGSSTTRPATTSTSTRR